VKPRIAIPEPHSQKPDYVQRALPQYEHAVELAGGEPVRIPLEGDNHEIARLITRCDAVLLPGSPADINPQRYGVQERHPQTAPPDSERDNADELLLQDAHNMHKPVLGICYGMQSLNVWRNGKLLQHVESHSRRGEKRVHTVRVEPGSLLESIVLPAVAAQGEAVWVNSSHHQAVEAPGDGLRVVARAEDGVVEAVEGTAPEHFVLGVQWHPERTVEEEPASLAIFRALVEAARRWQEKPRHPVQDFESLPR
jgi:putative glutamine amidotransferase